MFNYGPDALTKALLDKAAKDLTEQLSSGKLNEEFTDTIIKVVKDNLKMYGMQRHIDDKVLKDFATEVLLQHKEEVKAAIKESLLEVLSKNPNHYFRHEIYYEIKGVFNDCIKEEEFSSAVKKEARKFLKDNLNKVVVNKKKAIARKKK